MFLYVVKHDVGAKWTVIIISNIKMSLQFTGRVAVISGAGRGLGATYARELAKRGALVVVNDLDETEIIAEINNAGGKAVYNGDSVEDPEAIIKCAIDNFGKVDIVINNAGMTRD